MNDGTLIFVAALGAILLGSCIAGLVTALVRVRPTDEDGLCVRCGAALSGGAKCRKCGHAVRDV